MTDKEAQLKAKLLKIKLAEQKKWSATGLSPEEVQKVRADHEKRRKYMKLDPTKNKNKVTESDFQSGNFEIKDAKAKVNKLKKKYVDPNPQAETPEEIMQSAESAGREPSYIAQEHGHRISFRGHSAGNYKTASLNEQSGKYAKYWLLNAKDTNGNGWGIAAHTAKDNMKKFIGRPLVVTASSWHGASEYGNEYEHPYLPTNDITAILDHQEKFRVGSIVDVVEDSHGDWYANVEMLPKFANSRLPPFCSPAIYQLDASEAEGQISKWEALHLAALTENPAYGARIALLKGTCVGTGSECKVQFKVAKQEATTVCPKKKQKISRLKARLAGTVPIPNEDGSEDREISDRNNKKYNKFKIDIDNLDVPSRYPRIDLVRDVMDIEKMDINTTDSLIKQDKKEYEDNEKKRAQNMLDIDSGKIKKIRPRRPTQFDRVRSLRGKEDPTEKVIREVKDPEKKKDLLNRLDEKPNEHGPKNYGATKPKNFGKKIGKLKQKLYIAQQSKLQKTALSETPLNPKNSFNIRLKKGVKNTLYDPKYVYYNIMANVDSGFVKKNQLGSVQQYIRKNDLSKMRINNPDTGSWNELGEIADIRTGVIEPEDGDVSFQSKGSPGKLYYHDIKPNKTAKLKARLAGMSDEEKGFDSERYRNKGKGMAFRKNYIKHKKYKNSTALEKAMSDATGGDVFGFNGSHFISTEGEIYGTGYDDHRNLVERAVSKSGHRGLKKTMKGNDRDALMRQFMRGTGMVRVNGHSDSMSIDTHHPLTRSQHRVIKDHIDAHEISPNEIYIDDYSKNKNIEDSLRYSKLKTRLAVTASKKIPTSKVEGFAPLPNKRGDVSEFAKSLRTKKRDIYEELGHEKGKTVPYNIVKRPNRYTHKEEYEKGKKQFVDHIHARNNRPQETMNYMKKHGIHEEFEENRKQLSVAERREKGIGTGFDHPNIAGYTAENAVRWSKLKARLANLGEQNMTYQDSKKVKIHKKKNMEKHDKS